MLAGIVKSTGRLRNLASALSRRTDGRGRKLAYLQAPVEHLKQHASSNVIIDTDRPIDVYCRLSSPESIDLDLHQVQAMQIHLARAT